MMCRKTINKQTNKQYGLSIILYFDFQYRYRKQFWYNICFISIFLLHCLRQFTGTYTVLSTGTLDIPENPSVTLCPDLDLIGPKHA